MSRGAINSRGQEIPDKTLVVLPHRGVSNQEVAALLESLAGRVKRDWFTPHFYFCLPLTIGNQYGYIVKASRDFSVQWNGDPGSAGLTITTSDPENRLQRFDGHFGHGILTIQHAWHFRTPPGVNLMTFAPPNFPQHGIMHMTGVVETDNLRRDFTFNLRVTAPGVTVHFRAGDPIGALLPIPRYFADRFAVKFVDELFSPEQIDLEHSAHDEFARRRLTEDQGKPHQVGRLYYNGEDAWGNPFPDHQKP